MAEKKGGSNILGMIFDGLKSAVTDPSSVVDPQDGMFTWSALFNPAKREQFATTRQLMQVGEQAKAMQAVAQAGKSLSDLFATAPTQEATWGLAQSMGGSANPRYAGGQKLAAPQEVEAGNPLVDAARRARNQELMLGRKASATLPAEAGITPEIARIMQNPDIVDVAKQGSQAGFTRGTQYQQAALTQANQANQAALTRQTQEMRQQGQVQSAKQIAKAKARIGRKGERVEGRDAVTFLKEYQKDAAYQTLPLPQKAAINAAIRTGGKAAQTAAEDVAKMAGGEAGTKINIVNPGTVVNELRKEIAAGENALSGLAQIRELAETDPQAFQNPISALSYIDRMAETFGVNVSDANERRQAVITAAESSFNDYMLTIGGTTVAAGLMDQLRKTWVNAGDNDVQALVKVRAAEKRIRAANTLRTKQIAGLMSEKQLEQALRDNAEEFASELEQIEDESELDVTDEMDLTDEEKAEAARYGIPTE